MIRVPEIGSACCCVHVARSDEDGWRIPAPDPRCMGDHGTGEQMSIPEPGEGAGLVREMRLPEAIREIKRKLYPALGSLAALQEIATRLGVGMRTVQAWQAGETGVNAGHVKALQDLAREAGITIEAGSMVWGSGSRTRRKK